VKAEEQKRGAQARALGKRALQELAHLLIGEPMNAKEHLDLAKEIASQAESEGRNLTAKEKKDADFHIFQAKRLREEAAQRAAVKSLGDQVGMPAGHKGVSLPSSKQGASALTLSTKDVEDIQNAAISGQFLRKTVGTTQAPFSTITSFDQDVVPLARDKARLLDYIPIEATDAPSVAYFRATTGATAADAVAEGANKPESNPVWEQVTQAVRKIAHYTRANDEVLSDFSNALQVISQELISGLVDEETDQLLNGSGVAPALQGFLGASGVQTQARGTLTNLDALLTAANKLRTGSAYTEADTVVVHPDNFSSVLLSKDSQGGYIVGNPLSPELMKMQNASFVVTTRIAAGTALVASFQDAARVYVREAPRVEVHAYGGGAAEFVANQTLLRAEERLASALIRPAALCKVTGLN
jgi:HK97 family phage major capsid protein